MDATQVIFILSAALIVASALKVVTTNNLVHAALWLVAALFGVAILYALLEANFLAVVQVVVYIGAIAIMFIFAVMLTRKELRDKGPQLNAGWPMAAVLGVLTLGGLLAIVTQFPAKEAVALSGDPLPALAEALVSPMAYVLPFEVASVLLLAALVGAVYVATNKK
jgi:NADH-quinone oxidoreductase subunit J